MNQSAVFSLQLMAENILWDGLQWWETSTRRLLGVLPHSDEKKNKSKTGPWSWFCEPCQTEFSRASHLNEPASNSTVHAAFSRRVLEKNPDHSGYSGEFRHTFSSALVISVLEVLKVNIKSTGRTSPWEPESSAFQFQPYKWCSKEGESAYPFSHIISRGFNPAESCHSMSTITAIVLDAVQRPDAWRRCPSALMYLCKDTKSI